MKFLVLGDLHLRSKSPEKRKDNIFEAQMDKLNQVVEYARKNEIGYIIQTGDFFDNSCPDREVLNEVIRFLYENMSVVEFIAVYGQHDLYMRSYKSLSRTGLNLLYQAGLVEIADDRPIIFDDKFALYGMSYGKEIPQIHFEQSEKTNILLSHEPIKASRKLENDKTYINLVKKLNNEEEKVIKMYNLFINGDWHHPYCEGKLRILNPGAMTRLSIVERDIKPGFEVLNIKEDGDFYTKRIDFVCADWRDIFDISEEHTQEKNDREDLSFKEFLDGLRKGIKGEEGISFYDNVLKWLDTEKNKEIKEIVMEALKYAKEKGNS